MSASKNGPIREYNCVQTAILSKPPVLVQADGEVVDQVIRLFPHQVQVPTHLANAMEPLKPEHVRRLRTAAAARME